MILLNTKEAAAYLRVNPKYIQFLVRSGELSVYRPDGRKLFFKKEWLDKYIEQNTVGAV